MSIDDDELKSKLNQKEQWKPTHWADKVIDKQMGRYVELSNKIY
jgi:hypothetical protein